MQPMKQRRSVLPSARIRGVLKERLNPLLTFVDRYAKVFGVLVQVSGGGIVNPAALIWGLLRVLVEVQSPNSVTF